MMCGVQNILCFSPEISEHFLKGKASKYNDFSPSAFSHTPIDSFEAPTDNSNRKDMLVTVWDIC